MKIIIKYLKPFFPSILLIIILTFGQAIADLLLPNYMAEIVDEGIAKQNFGFILRTGGIMLFISLLGIGCAIIAGYNASKVALGVGKNLRNNLFKYVSGYSLSEFNQIGTASLITRTTNDVQQIQNTSFMMLRMMLRAPLMCIGGIIMAVKKDAELSFILLAMLPVIALIILLVSKKVMPLFRQIQQKLDKLNLVLRENLIGIRIIRAFARVGYEKRRFAQANTELTDTSIKVNRIMAILNPVMSFSMNLIFIVIVWLASFRIDAGNLMIGDMMAFIQYSMQIFMSLAMLTMMFIMLPRAFASGERINELLSVNIDIADPIHPIDQFNKKGYLEFKNVTFRYDNAEHAALNNISFAACPGETIAIIGGTGAGKSTLVNLILRYYDIESGNILIDGVDVRDMRQDTLRDKIGFVPQQAVLFSGSIYENIRIGKQNATDQEVHHACQIAQASEFIDRMGNNYNSEIAQGGTNLSGGQKQRLAIARAIIRKPEIYIFDDSFSALDHKTEATLKEALIDETKQALVIIVAQRIISIRQATRIVVMDNGNMVGIGTHDMLLKTNEIYREIVESQLSDDEVL